MKKVTAVMVVAAMLWPVSALAGNDELYGTYKLVSFTRQIVETGEVLEPFGKSPSGILTYGRDGRMVGLLVAADRPKPKVAGAITDQERATLFRTLIAYSGTYSFNGKTVEHHVDISHNELWTGTTLVRDVAREGDTLTLITRPSVNDGKVSISKLTWKRIS